MLTHMDESAEPRILIDTGGLAVSDDGRRVLVIDRRTSGLSTVAFVLGVITLVVGGLGAVGLLTGMPSRALGALFVAAGSVVAALTWAVVRTIGNRRSRPLREYRPVAVLDRQTGVFSHCGGVLLPLDLVRFQRRLQIVPSSPKLVAVTPYGTVALKRGNPFDGGIGRADEVLNAVVHSVRRVGPERAQSP
jgi:hypothetical protein